MKQNPYKILMPGLMIPGSTKSVREEHSCLITLQSLMELKTI